VFVFGFVMPVLAGAQTVPSELEALRAQLEMLQQRLTALEQAQSEQAAAVAVQAASNAEQQESIDRTTDSLAQTRAGIGEWVSRFQWRGDLRYRNETIDQEFTSSARNRDRIRARIGFQAKVNDTVRVEVRAATGQGTDARSANQTLTDANSDKALDLDLAYAEWQASDQWRLTLGKMRYPWARTSSYFYDGDVNPEGVAVNWQQGALGWFGGAYYMHLAERSSQADSNMLGAQLGWRGDITDGARVTVAASYFDHGAVEGYNPFLGSSAANAYGNTLTTRTDICRRGITTCLANDYNITNLMGELATTLAGRPLTVFVDYARNGAADYSNPFSNPLLAAPAGLDTAYAVGFTYGRASSSTPRSWEVGYTYQKTEKDALFAQWIDSNFTDGNSDGEGSVVRFAYSFARNWRANATYFMNTTNIDVPVQVSVPVPRIVSDRDYRRLQLDLNMTF